MMQTTMAKAALCILSTISLPGCAAPPEPLSPAAIRVQELLRPWDSYDPAWESQATVIVVARGEEIDYPCEFDGGTWSMTSGDGFVVTEVVKGAAEWRGVTLVVTAGDEPNFPPDYAAGRRYLVMLTPGQETMAELTEPDAWKYFGPSLNLRETVAVVDLSKSEAETTAMSVQATRSGEYEDFAFSPAGWQELRQAERIDPNTQNEYVAFLANVVLVEGATLADIRSYLGPPDRWYTRADSFWGSYQFNARRPKPDGSVSARLEITLDGQMKLTSYTIVFYEHWTEMSRSLGGDAVTSYRIRALANEELAELGLEAIKRQLP